jgi:hypothetical protein
MLAPPLPQVLESLELLDAFNVKLSVPALDANSVMRVLSHMNVANTAELQPILGSVSYPPGIPIKKLLLIIEMAMAQDGRLDPARFAETLQRSGILA